MAVAPLITYKDKFLGVLDKGTYCVAEFYIGNVFTSDLFPDHKACFDRKTLAIRIENGKKYGLDATEDLRALDAVLTRELELGYISVSKHAKLCAKYLPNKEYANQAAHIQTEFKGTATDMLDACKLTLEKVKDIKKKFDILKAEGKTIQPDKDGFFHIEIPIDQPGFEIKDVKLEKKNDDGNWEPALAGQKIDYTVFDDIGDFKMPDPDKSPMSDYMNYWWYTPKKEKPVQQTEPPVEFKHSFPISGQSILMAPPNDPLPVAKKKESKKSESAISATIYQNFLGHVCVCGGTIKLVQAKKLNSKTTAKVMTCRNKRCKHFNKFYQLQPMEVDLSMFQESE